MNFFFEMSQKLVIRHGFSFFLFCPICRFTNSATNAGMGSSSSTMAPPPLAAATPTDTEALQSRVKLNDFLLAQKYNATWKTIKVKTKNSDFLPFINATQLKILNSIK